MKMTKLQLALSAAALVAVGTSAYADPPGTVRNANGFVQGVGVVAAGISSGGATLTTNNGGAGGVGGDGTSLNTSWGGGLMGSAHDFTMATGADLITSVGASNTESIGLCTFCHTPHKASTTLLLWNHTLSSNTFSWNASATTSGTSLPGFVGTTWNGPSAKCLSCHDGSVAIGDVGWFDDTAHTTGSTAGVLNSATMKSSPDKLVGAGGDLSGNHPVAIPYPYEGAPNVYNGSTTGQYLATDQFVKDPTANNIRLYADLGGDNIVGHPEAGKTGIECSSCHDPHNKASKGDFFLRGALNGSSQGDGYICLQCHIK